MTRTRSAIPDLVFQCRAAGLQAPKTEHRFCARRWRFDLAWPDVMLAVEVNGGLFTAGRHVRGVGAMKDMEKINTALLLGWRVLTVAPSHVRSGQALAWIEQGLRGGRIGGTGKLRKQPADPSPAEPLEAVKHG